MAKLSVTVRVQEIETELAFEGSNLDFLIMGTVLTCSALIIIKMF